MNANETLRQRRLDAPERAGASGIGIKSHRRHFDFTRKAAQTLVAALILVVALAACSTVSGGATPTSAPATPAAATSGIATPTGVQATPATTTPLPVGSPATPSTTTTASAAATPSAAVADAIKGVIQRANQEQEQAVAANDPTLMQDTATAAYYAQSAQGLTNLTSSGVTAIQLVNLQWGPITLQGATAAQATTTETWRTTFADSSTTQATDTNVYTLVLEGGAWKIQDDQQPASRLMQPPPGTPGAAPSPVVPVAPAGVGQSRNWAGYAAIGGTFTAVSGTWTVPNVTPGSGTGADATWVGIGGVSSTDLIQAGTDATVQAGQVSYTAWIELLPQASQPVPLAVGPGDSVTVSIAQQPAGMWQIAISDATTGQSYQTSVAYASSLSSAEWVEESPSAGRRTILPLDNFGAITFTGATTVVGGQQQTIAQAGGQSITMTTTTGQALAQPSALGADGGTFTVTRTSVPAPVTVPRTGEVPGTIQPSSVAARRRDW